MLHCTAGGSLNGASSYLSAAVQMGILKSQSGNGLNLVSAPAAAKEVGIKVHLAHEYSILIPRRGQSVGFYFVVY